MMQSVLLMSRGLQCLCLLGQHSPWRLRKDDVRGPWLRRLLLQARQPTPGVPLVAFTLKAEKRTHGYNEFDIADRLRQFGWVVPVRAPVLCCEEQLTRQFAGCRVSGFMGVP